MQTLLSEKYKRKFEIISDTLEDEQNIEIINNDLQKLAQPSNKSYLNELIEKIKEIAVEVGIDLDNEASFELTDS